MYAPNFGGAKARAAMPTSSHENIGLERPARVAPNWAALAGLRGVLALVVVAVHYQEISARQATDGFVGNADGALAVWLFLIISGFSITHSCSQYSPKEFFWRRFRRIYPTYVTGVLLGVLLVALLGVATLGQGPIPPWLVIGHLFFLQTIFCPVWGANVALWSLPTEIVMYAAAPWIARVSLTNLKRAIVAMCAASFLLNESVIPHVPHMWGIDVLLWGWYWLLGAQLYRVYRDGLPEYPWAYLAAACLVLGEAPGGGHGTFAAPLLIASFALFLNLKRKFSLGPVVTAALNFAGDVSYPLYCCHYPVLLFMSHHSWRASLIWNLSVCLAVAIAVNLGIERPLRWLGHARQRRITLVAPAMS
jgi:peptidoglycan/LPS O-acetylase OafA/YrhL